MSNVFVNEKEFLFVEKYRPLSVSECILPDRIKNLALNLVQQGEINNMMFFGTGGTGKTTLALALAHDVGSDILVINCSNENGIDTIRTKLTQFASSVSLAGKPKIAVLDEADGLTIDAQRSLRNFIEQYSKNCRFIFTCNFKNKLIDPLHSRLSPVDFSLSKEEKSKVVVQFFKRICEILTLENYTFEKQVVAKIIEKNFPDFRRTLGELQKFGIQNEKVIDSTILKAFGEIEFSELFDALKTKDFKKMRAWVASNIENDVHVIYRKLFDNLNTTCSVSCIPNMILLLADYSYKAAFVQDQEINLVACLTEMMAGGEWL